MFKHILTSPMVHRSPTRLPKPVSHSHMHSVGLTREHDQTPLMEPTIFREVCHD